MFVHAYTYMCACVYCIIIFIYATIGRGQLRINKIENVGKALTFLTQDKKVCTCMNEFDGSDTRKNCVQDFDCIEIKMISRISKMISGSINQSNAWMI